MSSKTGESESLQAPPREQWSGQLGFLIAAIGSAIGLGNIWRFPGVAYTNGGGAFIIENKAVKARYLSKALVALWAKADAHTPKGDVGPVDFDPVTNSQEPDVKSFKVDAEKMEADKATVAVTITGHRNDRKPADQIVRYDLVREANSWKIDDISGASDGEAWSIRKMLTDSLKS